MAEHVDEGESAAKAARAAKKLDPFALVVLTRERVQEVFDEAVQRGRMTTSDAQQLVAEIVRRSLRQTDEVLADIEQLLGGGGRSGDRAVPIADYDELTASEVVGRLDGVDKDGLRAVRDHEKRNANRKTVLAAVERALAA